jgi:cell division septal protein FtsQ
MSRVTYHENKMKNKKISFWLFFILVVLMAGYLVVRTAIVVVRGDKKFAVKSITVITDGGVSQAVIAAESGIQPGVSAFSIDLDAVRDRLSQIQDLESVSVRRLSNGKIEINAKARKTVAVLLRNDLYYPISSDGTISGEPFEERPNGYLAFLGNIPAALADIVKLINKYSAVAARIDHLEWVEGRRLDLYSSHGTRIMMPESEIENGFKILAEIQSEDKILDRAASTIDLRDTTRTLVRVDSKK